ncbi:alpha/beta fold hydrolase [Micromonospora auratinigra]|uniref:Pimeloyl-ACP methyl ester carboxylesterase n=1 Tax=Micromonospora auratinigra TaxID=261654 RepID=A0A1A8ZM40_9ACTN|nr:alpha/beta hydrolase [Micromonospora auratinigra]SBT45151.1 Pimeloyl-ACP methyl ester carboxylesterase [Micromonospora auratinigra]
MTIHLVPQAGTDPIAVHVDEYGTGDAPFLLLHGGAGPQSMTGFAALLAERHPARVLVPTHPGFGGTARPEPLTTVADLARLYADLLEEADLHDVTVVGSSLGGWVAAELALLSSPRVGRLVLLDAVGIEVLGHPVADFFALTMDEVFQLSYHDPAPFRFDPATLPPAAQAMAAGNRAALGVYGGRSMADPTLAGRLAGIGVPTLVLWGDSDRIADVDYGRAYAGAVPAARFRVLPDTGHLPQLETPEQTVHALLADVTAPTTAG